MFKKKENKNLHNNQCGLCKYQLFLQQSYNHHCLSFEMGKMVLKGLLSRNFTSRSLTIGTTRSRSVVRSSHVNTDVFNCCKNIL
ncbi:hypothetical protein BpHYR1_048031 [Brachionus plicatilis]|uniref:Uncharacterized protein n=1 Tax=Brachionus plicatilis TaxID=10195 RepID=A0A3M7TA12_BRAPC|nr:hypothetical protein BpHYR1_048031 [Brachionus plicatilis]